MLFGGTAFVGDVSEDPILSSSSILITGTAEVFEGAVSVISSEGNAVVSEVVSIEVTVVTEETISRLSSDVVVSETVTSLTVVSDTVTLTSSVCVSSSVTFAYTEEPFSEEQAASSSKSAVIPDSKNSFFLSGLEYSIISGLSFPCMIHASLPYLTAKPQRTVFVPNIIIAYISRK